ncbi:MAG TPA: hypothetical protein VGH98_18550 [Gemmatimonadaceae bacterium]|jgi:hypothetical protein
MTPATVRLFVIDSDVWTVYEDRRDGPLRLGPALIFENDRVARRVRHYPANWLDLSDVQLRALSWSR